MGNKSRDFVEKKHTTNKRIPHDTNDESDRLEEEFEYDEEDSKYGLSKYSTGKNFIYTMLEI